MNDMISFTSPEYGQIRTITRDGEPWFVAGDVCKALDISNSRKATARLDDDEKGVTLSDTPGGNQEMTIINEPGLYTLVLGSRKPEAKSFKRWITHEVIPAIRKTGKYAVERVTVEQRPLTTDDYMNAASLISRCPTERLDAVVSMLESAGWRIPKEKIKKPEPVQIDTATPITTNRPLIDEKTPLPLAINTIIGVYGLTVREVSDAVGVTSKNIIAWWNGGDQPTRERAREVVRAIAALIPA